MICATAKKKMSTTTDYDKKLSIIEDLFEGMTFKSIERMLETSLQRAKNKFKLIRYRNSF
jgi:dihydroneopterin aldolase